MPCDKCNGTGESMREGARFACWHCQGRGDPNAPIAQHTLRTTDEVRAVLRALPFAGECKINGRYVYVFPCIEPWYDVGDLNVYEAKMMSEAQIIAHLLTGAR